MRALSDKPAPYPQEQLGAMTNAQLLVIARGLGVEGLSDRSLKADIIKAIQEVL